jgi:hypothetical protein
VFQRARAYHERFGLDLPTPSDIDSPLILTGHQPEIFHPGVWVKNFAVDSIARRHGAIGLNLVVDHDLPKAVEIRVPHRRSGTLKTERVEFDRWSGEIPFEDLDVRDEDCFASFADRVRGVLDDAVADPVIDRFWPIALAQREKSRRLGVRFALARRSLEASWGVHNHEVLFSDVCETEGFLWFVSHILANLPRFQAVHNAALARYRALYRIRSKHHPVAALGRDGEWLEAPFWIWRASEPRRRPLLIRQLARTMELRIGGEDRPLMEIPLGPDREACCAVEQLFELPVRKVRMRTRALTTTMFARLLLGDLFLHGIGGAKYDELGDEVIRRFFGIEPPAYLTLSMTLWLGLDQNPATRADLDGIRRGLRELTFNPDRHLPTPIPDEALRWVEAKQRAIAEPVETHRQRVARLVEIRRSNEALQAWMAGTRADLRDEQSRVIAGLRENALARSREYSFVLHSEHRLREAIHHAVGGKPVGAST